MEQDQVSAYYEVSPYVTAVSTPAELPNVVAKRHRRNRVYGHLAMPDGTSKPWFNEGARDLMRLLTVDPSVSAFTSRPTKIILSVDGRRVEHTPDLKVERPAETAIVDVVRPRERRDDQEVAEALRRICMRHGLVYRRFERETIYRQPRFDNACEILRFKSVVPDPELAFRVVDLLSRTDGIATRGTIEDAFGGRDLVVPGLYALSLRRVVAIEMGKRLSRDSLVRLLSDDALS